jgi:hypothetical protein
MSADKGHLPAQNCLASASKSEEAFRLISFELQSITRTLPRTDILPATFITDDAS